ncbi:hypothetical protein EWM64_g5215 [Hericium alpestre]|uniref:Uncharacterized protein n=1 Tax=Hericium alpestre TaxID=135208 RepID=A0A4Y9ZZ65_9AGAM|nr:hypothetical protein EWM64_g5215 [Hericium alpestre]
MVLQKRRKISDLIDDDENVLLNALTTFQATLDEDEEDLPPELLPALEKFRTKLGKVPVGHVLLLEFFSRTEDATSALLEERRAEAEAVGRSDIPSNAMSLDITKELIQLVCRHVSMSTDAGCRMLIDIILLRIASVMQDSSTEVEIMPEFPVSETASNSRAGEHSFSGTLDYLLAKIPVKYVEYFRETPVFAVGARASDPALSSLMPCIIRAKKDNITAAIPQATVAVHCHARDRIQPELS